MQTLIRPNWDTTLKYAHNHSSYCPTCKAIITNRKALQVCWLSGHFDGITEIDAAEPAPRSTMIYVQPHYARFILIILPGLFLVIGVILGRLIK